MKEAKGNNIRLGVFVAATIAVFIITIYFVGRKQQLFHKTFHISGIFKDISGLQVGNNVRFSGINVGIVEDIEQITDTTVRVDMEIDADTKKFMKKNAQAIIGSDGLMGNKILLIIPRRGNAAELENNDIISTAPQVSMDDILEKVRITTENAATISGDLAIVMSNIKEGKGTIGKLLMDSTMAENVDDALVNIKKGAGGFKQNMDAASHNVLLRGYIKKKAKEAEKVKEEKAKEEKKEEKEQRKNE
jgi:phospholipid/cholesterol/gamma-HCH transport system substrate-binding protein